MKQFIESVEGIFSLENLHSILRYDGKGNDRPALRLFYHNEPEESYTALYFESTRGRDAAYAEVMGNLGRSSVIQIGRYQDWPSK